MAITNQSTREVQQESLPLHLVVLGGGVAGFSAATHGSRAGARVTVINDGFPAGGRCVNTGCLSSKTLLHIAHEYYKATHKTVPGIEVSGRISDFSKIMRYKRQLIAQFRENFVLAPMKKLSHVRYLQGHAQLLSSREVLVNQEEVIEADRIIIATGLEPLVPRIKGIEKIVFMTVEQILDVDHLPESLIVVGANKFGLECAQTFARFGSTVTVLEDQTHILSREERAFTKLLSDALENDGIEILCNARLREVDQEHGRVLAKVDLGRRSTQISSQYIVFTDVYRPNTAPLGLENGGVKLTEQGYVLVDETLETTAPGVYGAGDVVGHGMHFHMAVHHGQMAALNAIRSSPIAGHTTTIPWIIYTDPQIAGVGLDTHHARNQGYDAEEVSLPLAQVPAAQVINSPNGVIKLIRERRSDRLVGARLVSPHCAELLTQLSLAVRYGLTTRELMEILPPYLTLSEGVQYAAQQFHQPA